MNLDECRAAIGQRVAYDPGHGSPEYGVITSVSNRFAFVLYDGDRYPQATSPRDLHPA